MKFLYGDSTPSPLQSNYLFFVRDAMEFCVHLLLAQERIASLREQLRVREQHGDSERARIEGLRVLVLDAAGGANTDGPASMSKLAVDRVIELSGQAIATTLTDLETKLAAERAEIARQDREERDGCNDAFAKYIALHEVHEGEWRLSAKLGETGHYEAETSGRAPFGAAWRCALELQGTHPMANGIRVGDLVTLVEVSLPEGSGWQKRNPKRRPQRIDGFSIDELMTNGENTGIALRATPRSPIGIDVEISGNAVRAFSAGARDPFDIELDDDTRQRFLTLRSKLIDALTIHPGVRRRVITAMFDDAPFAEADDLVTIAKRVIDGVAPIVKEIRAHSLTPHELVIRRLLDDNSRVEIFVSKAELLEKLGRLPRNLRSIFEPLGLEWQRAQTPPPGAIYVEPPRAPPPERPVPEDEPPPAPAAQHAWDTSEQSVPAREAERPAPAIEHDAVPTPSAIAAFGLPSAIDSAVQQASIIIDPELAEIEAPPQHRGIEIDASDRQALAATVKRIVGAAREGATQLAFQAYAALFEDDNFARQRPQDQRQVLKLLVMAKSIPPPTQPVIHAYRTALDRLRVLAEVTNDPVDSEMLGVCLRMLARFDADAGAD